MGRKGLPFLSSLALLPLLVACSPMYLHLPEDLADGPLVNDIREELRWTPFAARLAPAGRTVQADRDLLLFREADDTLRTLHYPEDRLAILIQAVQWLAGESEGPVLIIVPENDRRRQDEAEFLRSEIQDVTVLAVAVESDAEQAMSGIRREIHRHDNLAGVLVLSGDFGVSLAQAIFNSLQDPPPLVLELLFAAHGTRLRQAGIEISGAVVVDLAETVRTLAKDSEAGEDVYMVSRFVRY